MSYQDIRNTREGFVDMGAGDKLIRIESKILAIVVFIVLLAYLKMGVGQALIAGVVVGFVFPWLVGLVEFFAWVATIIFSVIWAGIGYFIAGALGGDSPVIGAIGAIIIFVASFFLHKIFAGLGYSSVEKHALDAWDNTSDNTAQTRDIARNIGDTLEKDMGNVKYCQKCGTAMDANAKFCAKCGSSQ